MDVERATEELTERKVVRRGLLTGIAALGAAAMVKLSGASKAEAAHQAEDVGLNINNAGTATTQITASVAANPGFMVVNGGVAASGKSGIVGVSDAVNGGGVRGYNDVAGGFGVGGDSANGFGVKGLSSTGVGVVGQTTGNTGLTSGVLGLASGSITYGVRAVHFGNGIAVRGLSNDSSPTANGDGAGIGVQGRSGSGIGVQGDTVSNIGVLGNAANSAVSGVEGRAGAGSAQGIRGVHFNNGTGIKGVSNVSFATSDGNGNGIGVHGKSYGGPGVKGESTDAPGVQGISLNQPGIEGTSTNSLGIRGTSTNFVGIVGISTNNHGLYGSSSGPNAYGIVAENTIPNGPGLLVTGNAQIFGALQVFGVKNAVIRMADGSNAAVYCQESPEPYFEDFGRAQLVGGVANVPLEREFATLVAGADYHVFLTPEGAAQGLYVSRRSPTGFEVRDLGNGSVAFSYRIVTKRKDVDGKRFARVSTQAAQSVAGVRAVLNSMGTPGSYSPPTQQPGATAPTPGFTVSPGLTVQQPGATP